jgi:hypothetical protein
MKRVSIVAIVLVGLAGCGQQATQTITPASVGASAAEPRPAFPLAIDSAAFNTTVRTGTSQCGAQTFPLEGADAFEAAMRRAVATAQPRARPRAVRIAAGTVGTQFAFEPGDIARPAMRLTARITIEPASGPARTETLEWTGRAYGVAGVMCGGVGAIIADAYRDAVEGLAERVRERVSAAR